VSRQIGLLFYGLHFTDVVLPDEVRKTVIGLARDLRGLVFAFNTKVSYMMLFDWLYPTYTPILHRAVEIWYQDPQVRNLLVKSLVRVSFSCSGWKTTLITSLFLILTSIFFASWYYADGFLCMLMCMFTDVRWVGFLPPVFLT
jgi:hypothetical protein